MDNINISTLDLNLLRAFVVLMEERSVSRASERLNLTQSAVSNTLERLRSSLNDRVLEREGRSMQPTRSALTLWPRISAALAEINSALSEFGDFDPATLNTQFRVGIDEYSLFLYGDTLIGQLYARAPNVQIELFPVSSESYTESLTKGEVDILIAPVWQTLPDLVSNNLYEEHFIGLMRNEHPLNGKTMTLKRFVSNPHMLVSTRGIVTGNVDVALRREKLQREVKFSVPYLNSAVQLLQSNDVLLNVGERLGNHWKKQMKLKSFKLPIQVPGFTVKVVWHPRETANVQHSWLREQVKSLMSDPALD